ncbi:MAG: tetratricopeptide repeat protein [Myxococcales bacterium]|nr:tetratricopeptide repeat protein [Myxococcales bacterium]
MLSLAIGSLAIGSIVLGIVPPWFDPEAQAADRVPKSAAAERLDSAEVAFEAARRLGGVNTSDGRERLDEAARLGREALGLEPDYVRAAVLLGEVLLLTREHADADRLLTSALVHAPNDLALLHLAGIHRFRAGAPERGVPLLEAVVARDRQRFDAAYLLAGHYYRVKNDARALQHALTYLDSRPRDAAVHGMVGNLHLRAGRVQQAITAFERVLELDPGNLPVRVNLANVLSGLGDHAKAVELYEAVLAKDPTMTMVEFNLATAYWALGRYGAASAAFGAFISRTADGTESAELAQAYHYGGLSAARAGDTPLGLERLRIATDLAPTDPWPPYAVADLLRRARSAARDREATPKDDLTVADSFIALALQRKDDAPAIQQLAGRIARDRGDLRRARRHFETAQSLAPKNALVRAELGHVRVLSGDLDGGIDDLETARLLDAREPKVSPWLSAARTQRAVLRMRAGDDLAAESDLRRALEVGPLLAATWNLAWLLDLRGEPLPAMLEVRRALVASPEDSDLNLLLAYFSARTGAFADVPAALAKAGAARDTGLRDVVYGALLASRGESEAAVAAYESALALGFETSGAIAEVWLDDAAEHLRQRRPAEALAALSKLADALPPVLARARTTLEVVALLSLDGAAGGRPKGLDYHRLERLLAVLSRGDRRLPPLLVELGLAPLMEELDFLTAFVAYRLGDGTRAWASLDPLIRAKHPDAIGLGVVVLLELAEGDFAKRAYDAAASRVERALELAPGDPWVRHAAACLAMARGDDDGASRAFETLAATRTPPEAMLNFGQVLADLRGRSVEAHTWFRRYLEQGGVVARSIAKRRIERVERYISP